MAEESARRPGRKRRRRRGPAGRRAAMTVEERARRALSELRELALALAQRHGVSPDEVDIDSLVLTVRASVGPEVTPGDVEALLSNLDSRVSDAVRARSSFLIGRVYCFLCDSADCDHAKPGDARETFSGYRPTGKPEWQTFTNLCIERKEPRVDRLFGDPPEIIAVVQSAHELKQGLLPGFGQGSRVYNVLGQVVTGLLPTNLDPTRPSEDRVALTLQVVETAVGDRHRRLRLNYLGLSTEQIVEAAIGAGMRSPAESLRRTIRATRERVHAESHSTRAAEERGDEVDLEARIAPLLARVRGDLERCFRPLKRRTRHAQERHEGGERPTSRALADATAARDEHFLRDAERQTIIVLGPRSRAHVFSPTGRHVTSLQLRPGELERKVDRKRWRPMRRADVAEFRRTLGDDGDGR